MKSDGVRVEGVDVEPMGSSMGTGSIAGWGMSPNPLIKEASGCGTIMGKRTFSGKK